jgi:hypothetical protein
MAAPLFEQALPTAFSPLITDSVIVDSDYYGGTLSITELAESVKKTFDTSAVKALFPEETVEAELVRIQQEFEPVGTTLPLVQKGMPDTFLSQSGKMLSERWVQPFFMRGSFYVNHGEINSKVKPGTINQKWSPAEQLQNKVKEMMEAHELTWDVIRTYMLCGGFEFNDPRTNNHTEIPSNIPARNLFSYNVKNGYKGRQEHAWFRTIVDSNVTDPGGAPSGIPWTHPDAAIVECVRSLAHWYQMTYERPLTAMYLHPEMLFVLSMNRQIMNAMGGLFIPKIGAVAGDSTVSVQPTILDRGTLGLNGIAVDNTGTVKAIAGIPIYPINVKFKDPRDGTFHGIMPKNKIILVSNANGQPGRTQYCISEEFGGKPGLWTRTSTNVPPPNAPGYAFQIGNAGMVYLKYPENVVHINVCEVEDIQKRLVILGDYNQGVY